MVTKSTKTTAAKSMKSATTTAASTATAAATATPTTPAKAAIASVKVRRKEMVARIAASSGLKPNAIKTVLDSVLKEIGDALSNGESLDLPPLGKLSVNRSKHVKNAEILICKLRRNAAMTNTDAPKSSATAAE